MDLKREWKPLLLIPSVFLLCYFLPVDQGRFTSSILESFHLVKWYAREHVILCLIPAFFIAGAIGIFISTQAVLQLLGPKANKIIAYGVASVSGSVLAVCSCTILPLFSGIYRMGAGIGPATAFLYAGPAINILSIILTARILGFELGLARAICAIVFSIVIGLIMYLLFKSDEENREMPMQQFDEKSKPFWQIGLFFISMIAILIFANWGAPSSETGLWYLIYFYKWKLTAFFSVALAILLMLIYNLPTLQIIVASVIVTVLSFSFSDHPEIAFIGGVLGLCLIIFKREDETGDWFRETWIFAKQILPLLLFGVLIAGFLLGRPGHQGIIPESWVQDAVGGNSVFANFSASFVGAFMYFATLTEVPILQGLLSNGMGKGPALALLLAGPALSLPNMLVIRSVLGVKKTVAFIVLVIVMATISGLIFGSIV